MRKLANLFLVLSLFSLLIFPNLVLAENSRSGVSSSTVKSQNDEADPINDSQIQQRRQDIKERAKQRLEERKKRIASEAAEKKEKLDRANFNDDSNQAIGQINSIADLTQASKSLDQQNLNSYDQELLQNSKDLATF